MKEKWCDDNFTTSSHANIDGFNESCLSRLMGWSHSRCHGSTCPLYPCCTYSVARNQTRWKSLLCIRPPEHDLNHFSLDGVNDLAYHHDIVDSNWEESDKEIKLSKLLLLSYVSSSLLLRFRTRYVARRRYQQIKKLTALWLWRPVAHVIINYATLLVVEID